MSDFFNHILQRHRGESLRVEPRPRARFEPDSQTAVNLQPQAPPKDDAAPPAEDAIIPNAVASLDSPGLRRVPAAPSEAAGAAGRSMARQRDSEHHLHQRETGMDDTPPVREDIQRPSRIHLRKEIKPPKEEPPDPVPHRRVEAPTDSLSISPPRLPESVVAPARQRGATIHPSASPGDAEQQKERRSGTQADANPVPRVTPAAPTEPGAPPPALPRRQSLGPEVGAEEQEATTDKVESASDPPTPQRRDQALLVPPGWVDQLRSELDRHREDRGVPRPSEPTIQVTIGRVEVRAEAPPPPAARAKVKAPAVMSLEDYLKQRKGRGSP